MKSRWLIAAGVVALGGGYFLLRGVKADPDSQTAARSAKIELGARKPAESAVAPKQAPKMVMTESGWKPVEPPHQPREWRDPVSGALNREVTDAYEDTKQVADQELIYRKRRMRLALADAAQSCYNGADSKDEIELEYSIVVTHEEIRADNVRVKRSELKDPKVERCIIDAVRDMRALGEKIPDMKEEQGLVISLHDLWDRNRRDNQNKDDGATK